MNLTKTEVDRFFSKIEKTESCWNWTASTAGGGYGTVNIRKTNMPSHRVSWLISGKTIPEGHYVMSTCGNKRCCNPEHLVCSKHHGSQFRKDRFYDRVKKVPSGCWEWTGFRQRNGYGLMLINYRSERAHRYSYEIHKGPIPKGLCVLHKCDNPPCVNPDHLFLGTRKDNSLDMHAKHRNNQPKGEASAVSKLTDKAVRNIRKNSHLPASSFVEKYGVTRATIYAVRQKRTWKHVK